MEEHTGRAARRRGSLVGPAILIGIGIIFLLNNFGWLSWSVWETILRLWPVLVIAGGLDLLIGRRSVWGSAAALVLTLAVLAGALWLYEAGPLAPRAASREQVRQALEGASRARVEIAPAVGQLVMEALPESANLLEGYVELMSGERLVRDFSVKGDEARLVLRSEGRRMVPTVGSWRQERTWDLGLASGVPIDLRISMGVGQSVLDLSELTVTELYVDASVGQTTITLPAEGRYEAQIDSAIGELVVNVPEGLEARITVDTGISARQLPSGYRRSGDGYVSPGYAGADNRVDLKLDHAIGAVSVRRSSAK
jgi:hypothetical protein